MKANFLRTGHQNRGNGDKLLSNAYFDDFIDGAKIFNIRRKFYIVVFG